MVPGEGSNIPTLLELLFEYDILISGEGGGGVTVRVLPRCQNPSANEPATRPITTSNDNRTYLLRPRKRDNTDPRQGQRT